MSADADRIRALPCWNGAIDIAPLSGGLSNTNYCVADANGKHVVRFGIEYPFHHVARQRELMVARAAADAGFAPKIEYAEAGVMVTAFLVAKTYDQADVRANALRIGALLKNFHQVMPHCVTGAGFMFWVFHVIRDYAKTLHAIDNVFVERLVAEANAMEAVQSPLPIIFGHNDLLPGNFLDDGNKLWLIDFEYAGFNTAMFDLAGAASNASMSQVQAEQLMQSYFAGSASAELIKSFDAMQCASLIRETMWAMVSKLHLNAPGVDYVAYTAENLARYELALESYQSRYGKLKT